MAEGIPDYHELRVRKTLDFELEIRPGDGQVYPVTARTPGGETETRMQFPLALEELDYQLAVINDAVLASSAAVRRVPTKDEEPVQRLGRRLFDALLSDEVFALFVASAQRAHEVDAMLRLVLRIQPPELARLPWEFLFDSGRQDYLGLSLPLVRYPQALAPRRPLQVAAPLRILGMVARPGDQHALDVDSEQDRVRAALSGLERKGLVKLAWARGQTYSDLEDAMDHGPWHVFHFVGHGGYDRGSDEGFIALADEQGRTDLVGADDLSRLLGEHNSLRLVVLNACDTGRGSALDVFASTAAALMRRSIPAVVAMQFPITDPAAIRFAHIFYQNVAKTLPVDTSVMRARRALRRAKKDTLEWGTPVLYLRAPDGRIFDILDRPSELPPAESAGPEAEEQARREVEEQARQEQLAAQYAQASAAADADDWERAIAGYTVVAGADPDYRDTRAQLENARHQQKLAGLRAEARRLHRADRWSAVLKVGEQLRALDPTAADPDGLMTSARAELAAAEQAAQLAADYRTGLRLLEAGKWQQAVQTLEQVTRLDPAYRDAAGLLSEARREVEEQARRDAEEQARRDAEEQARKVPSSTRTPSQPGPPRPRRFASQAKPTRTFGDFRGITAVAFSPDGRQLATCNGLTVRLWDAASGYKGPKVAHRGRFGSTNPISDIVFSPDGRRLATGGSDKTARIFDTRSGYEFLRVTTRDDVLAVAFSPDGRRLATGSVDKTARIWAASSAFPRQPTAAAPGQELLKVTHDDLVYAVAFSPDGRRLATASRDSTARIWDTSSGQELLKVTHDDLVHAVAFSPDGRRLTTASRGSTARIWDTSSGQEPLKITHGIKGPWVALSPDGRWLTTTSADNKTLQVWNISSEQVLLKITHGTNKVTAVAFSPDGRWLATGFSRGAQIWDLDMGNDDEQP